MQSGSTEDKRPMATDEAPDFEIADTAARHIAENGRRLYIWSQPLGGSFVTTKTSSDEPQLDDTTFTRYDPEGLEVFVDETIPTPPKWVLWYQRFPRRHIRADGGGADASPSSTG